MRRFQIEDLSGTVAEVIATASEHPVALIGAGDDPDFVLIRADQYEMLRWRAGDRSAGRLEDMPDWLREAFIESAEAFAAETDESAPDPIA